MWLDVRKHTEHQNGGTEHVVPLLMENLHLQCLQVNGVLWEPLSNDSPTQLFNQDAGD